MRRTQTAGATNYYGNSSFGIAFNVNDDLSISYSRARHVQSKNKKQTYAANADNGSVDQINEYTPKSWMRAESIQVAYTIGGMGLKWARTTYDNTLFTFDDKKPKESQIVAVTLAF